MVSPGPGLPLFVKIILAANNQSWAQPTTKGLSGVGILFGNLRKLLEWEYFFCLTNHGNKLNRGEYFSVMLWNGAKGNTVTSLKLV